MKLKKLSENKNTKKENTEKKTKQSTISINSVLWEGVQ